MKPFADEGVMEDKIVSEAAHEKRTKTRCA